MAFRKRLKINRCWKKEFRAESFRKTALSHYLGNPYSPSITSVLSTNDIYVIINNVDPAYTQCRRKVGFLTYNYHAVALTGYSFTSSKTTIRIMDPAYECFKTCTYADGDWTFAFGDYTYKWYKTIRLMYSNWLSVP